MKVELLPITDEHLAAVFDLEVRPDQRHFVAPNPWSLAQALVKGDAAWPRALVTAWVEDDGGPKPFYEGLGFRATGEIEDGEIVVVLEFATK